MNLFDRKKPNEIRKDIRYKSTYKRGRTFFLRFLDFFSLLDRRDFTKTAHHTRKKNQRLIGTVCRYLIELPIM